MAIVGLNVTELIELALHDTLTGLPNRAYVHEYVGQALAHASGRIG